MIVINYFLSWHMPVAMLEAGAGSLESGSLRAAWAMLDNIFFKKIIFFLIFVSRIPATLADVFQPLLGCSLSPLETRVRV